MKNLWLSVKNACFVRLLWAFVGVCGGILLMRDMCEDSKTFMEFWADWSGYETKK